MRHHHEEEDDDDDRLSSPSSVSCSTTEDTKNVCGPHKTGAKALDSRTAPAKGRVAIIFAHFQSQRAWGLQKKSSLSQGSHERLTRNGPKYF